MGHISSCTSCSSLRNVDRNLRDCVSNKVVGFEGGSIHDGEDLLHECGSVKLSAPLSAKSNGSSD